MSTAIRSELLKLTTVRTTQAFLLATAGFVLFAVTFQAVSAGGEFMGPLADPATQHTLLTSGGIATVVAVVFGALGISGEFRHRTVVPTLLVAPDRVRMVVAKAIAGGAGGAAIGVAAVAAALLGTAAALLLTGTSLTVEAGPVLTAWAGTIGAAALGNLIGLGIGGIARNQALAVGVVLLLLLALEPLVASMVPDIAPWLPSSLSTTIADPSIAAEPATATAIGVYAAYGTVLTLAAAMVLRRTDIS
jgi:ABC-2 type transport system permease protein